MECVFPSHLPLQALMLLSRSSIGPINDAFPADLSHHIASRKTEIISLRASVGFQSAYFQHDNIGQLEGTKHLKTGNEVASLLMGSLVAVSMKSLLEHSVSLFSI